MQKSTFRSASALPTLAFLFCLAACLAPAFAKKMLTLETEHFRVVYKESHAQRVAEIDTDAQLAGEILEVAEAVWPTLAKAYDSYEHYQRIDIVITDDTDDANGYAIYNFSRVMIYAPHMDWVMRNRQTWIRNVVTHELAHVFSLRRAAYLAPVDAVELYGSTYNYKDKINYSFHVPWIPLVAPTWYIEGVAQFEAFMNDNDSWDSQRDMVVRDAYLTGTLPDLDFIETFEYDEDWTQAERCYNTGYAFLLYLKDRFGADKVRDLAVPKPFFNFSYSVEKAFGRPLPSLFNDWKRSLADRYADFKEIPDDSLADPDMVGGFQQNLAFSPNGKYMAWLGNDENRRAPLNWIYWKEIGAKSARKSQAPVDKPSESPAPSTPAPAPAPAPDPKQDGLFPGSGPASGVAGIMTRPRFNNPAQALGRGFGPFGAGNSRGASRGRPAASGHVREAMPDPSARRSTEFGSSGLEFNKDNTRLLTTRQDRYAQYTDIWEYEFRSKKSEDDKWRRLTWEERATYPSYHPTRGLIVYSRKKNGSSNLTVLDSAGRTRQLTNFSNGEQVYNPRFTPAGDSIYFTYGSEDKEAIAVIDAEAPGFDPFLTLQDSVLFPDTLNLAKNRRIDLVTPLKAGAIRNLRFAGDTLFWSANNMDSVYSVYDVFARLPGDSAVYRATQVAGQAMEPVTHGGDLYYQGYRKQQFRIFRRPLTLERTGLSAGSAGDTVAAFKPKEKNYTKAFRSGEYGGTKVALDITPFLSLQPVFISGDKSYTDIALGLNVDLGEAFGSWSNSFSGAITKRTSLDAPLNYQFQYSGAYAPQSIRHTRFDWQPQLYYSLYHDVVQSNQFSRETGGFPSGIDSIAFTNDVASYSLFTRDVVSAGMPLPYNFTVGAAYFAQHVTQDFSQSIKYRNTTTGEQILDVQARTNFLRDAPQHRNFESNLGWGYSTGMLGTYLPTGVGVWAQGHKYWATYENDYVTLDSINSLRLALQGKPAPEAVLSQGQYDPWSMETGLGGIASLGRHLSVFANVEAGAFLNKFPTVRVPAHVRQGAAGPDTVFVDQAEAGLWVLSYRLGYFRMSGYPYNFSYRGRDIMEGSSFAFGQYGVQLPIKMGTFLPGLPVTSFKQFLITAMGEWGTTLETRPEHIINALDNGEHHLLLDFGLRLSANFKLYHQLPFTIFAQGFVPYNQLKADNLFDIDYPGTGRRLTGVANGVPQYETAAQADRRDRNDYIAQVKEPRFFVGFNLGLF